MTEVIDELRQRWLSYPQASRYSGMSESTLRRLVEAKRLRVFRPTSDRKVILDREELDKLILKSVETSSVAGAGTA
jgi:excisionase family DNA binding protein